MAFANGGANIDHTVGEVGANKRDAVPDSDKTGLEEIAADSDHFDGGPQALLVGFAASDKQFARSFDAAAIVMAAPIAELVHVSAEPDAKLVAADDHVLNEREDQAAWPTKENQDRFAANCHAVVVFAVEKFGFVESRRA